MGGGVQGQKLWEHDSVITDNPKGPLCGPNFWSGFEALDPYALAWRPRPFSRNCEPKISISETEQHNINFSPAIDR